MLATATLRRALSAAPPSSAHAEAQRGSLQGRRNYDGALWRGKRWARRYRSLTCRQGWRVARRRGARGWRGLGKSSTPGLVSLKRGHWQIDSDCPSCYYSLKSKYERAPVRPRTVSTIHSTVPDQNARAVPTIKPIVKALRSVRAVQLSTAPKSLSEIAAESRSLSSLTFLQTAPHRSYPHRYRSSGCKETGIGAS